MEVLGGWSPACGDWLMCGPEPASGRVEIHRERHVAGRLRLAAKVALPQHFSSNACIDVKGITFATAVRVALSTKMDPMTCCSCNQSCTIYAKMITESTRLIPVVILRGVTRPCRLGIPRCIIHISCVPLRCLSRIAI